VYQASLLQLDNYGPWTVTPAPRPEMTLQALQARLYADVAAFVGERGGYAFYARGDNVVALTNGLDREDHAALQRRVRESSPVTASIGIGAASTPAAALADATARLQEAGSAQDAARTEVLRGEFVEGSQEVQIAHFDVVDATGTYTDSVDAYAAHAAIRRGVDALAGHLYREHDALAFFVGGDNAIAVCPDLSRADFEGVIDAVHTASETVWRVGVGEGPSCQSAGMDAKHALEVGRETGDSVVFAGGRSSVCAAEVTADDD
jgi:GTP cyclohydrolase IIa